MSLLLLRQILLTIVAQHAARAARVRDRAPGPAAVPARGPAPPPAPGLHDRRASARLARLMPQRVPASAFPRSRRSSRGASPCSAGSRSCCSRIVFFRLWFLQVLVGQASLRCAREPRPQGPDRGAARRHRGHQRRQLVTTKQAAVVQLAAQRHCRTASRRQADDYRKELAAAAGAAPAGGGAATTRLGHSSTTSRARTRRPRSAR